MIINLEKALISKHNYYDGKIDIHFETTIFTWKHSYGFGNFVIRLETSVSLWYCLAKSGVSNLIRKFSKLIVMIRLYFDVSKLIVVFLSWLLFPS